MKYFRSYPYGLQFFWFLFIWFTLSFFGVGLTFPPLFAKLTGFSISDLGNINPGSSTAFVNAAIVVEGLGNLVVFVLSALIFSHLTHPRPFQYLGLRAPGKKIQIILVVFLMLGAMPVLQAIESMISKINFGPAVKAMEATNENMMTAFLNITSFAVLIKVFVLLAIVPAVGEEMFFRGIFMKLVKKRFVSMVIPILFTSLVFAFFHASVYGMTSIFLAGVLLAVIYNVTGSLWCSIVAHLFFNGTQIILSYAGNTNATIKGIMANNTVPYYLVIGGAALFGISFYLLLKNKTPLPANWTDDFTPEELSQNAL